MEYTLDFTGTGKSFCMVLSDMGGEDEVIVTKQNIYNLIKTFGAWVTVGIELLQRPDGGFIQKIFDHRAAKGFIELALDVFERMDEQEVEHLEDIDDLAA